jgi:hypothetical protein
LVSILGKNVLWKPRSQTKLFAKATCLLFFSRSRKLKEIQESTFLITPGLPGLVFSICLIEKKKSAPLTSEKKFERYLCSKIGLKTNGLSLIPKSYLRTACGPIFPPVKPPVHLLLHSLQYSTSQKFHA